MKFADSIVKVYATSLAMLLTTLASIAFFSLTPTLQVHARVCGRGDPGWMLDQVGLQPPASRTGLQRSARLPAAHARQRLACSPHACRWGLASWWPPARWCCTTCPQPR